MRAVILLALAGSPTLACTELDALTGSEPDLPWSPDAPRGPLSRAEAGLYAATTSVVDGALELATDLPSAPGDCRASHPAALCADRDHDGLTDEWEDVLLDRLRPFVRIDAGDPLRIDGEGVVGSIGRVVRALDSITGDPRIRVFLVLGYSRDYGRCTFGSHRGDSERVALDLAPLPGQTGSVRVVGAYTAGHEGTINDSSQRFRGAGLSLLEYARDPVSGEARWAVYSSRSKHATYATPGLCESNDSWLFCGDEDCAAGRSIDPPNELLMSVVNAGEPGATVVEEFMGESVWQDLPFCGGLDGSEPCASPIVEKLLLDPFATR
jgi:hypothetical protein